MEHAVLLLVSDRNRAAFSPGNRREIVTHGEIISPIIFSPCHLRKRGENGVL